MKGDFADQFCRQLKAELRRRGLDSERAAAEAADHLREAHSRLLSEGHSFDEARRRALAQFGSARTVASAFCAELGNAPIPPPTRPGLWNFRREEHMTKPLMLAFSVATTLLALFIGLHALWDLEGHLGMIVLKLLSSAAIVWVGVMSWMTAFWERVRPAEGLLLGAVLLVALGAAGVVWVFYLAETTGDLEAWAIPVNLLLIAQGVVTTLYLWRNAGGKQKVA